MHRSFGPCLCGDTECPRCYPQALSDVPDEFEDEDDNDPFHGGFDDDCEYCGNPNHSCTCFDEDEDDEDPS